MNPSKPLACLALCAVLALAACDRRDAYPPEESGTTTDQISPPGTEAGHVTAPDASRTGGDRCQGLAGDALQECIRGAVGVPMILEDDTADARAASDEATGEAGEESSSGDPAEPNPTSDQDGNLQ